MNCFDCKYMTDVDCGVIVKERTTSAGEHYVKKSTKRCKIKSARHRYIFEDGNSITSDGELSQKMLVKYKRIHGMLAEHKYLTSTGWVKL